MKPPGQIDYIQNVQVLRFFATCMVLLTHLQHETADHRIAGMTAVEDRTGIPWMLGVDIFFIISGFIMYHLTAEKFGTLAYAGEFLKRRLILSLIHI